MKTELVFDHVTKKYKNYAAINDVSLKITGPVIYGLIGKNGAGKTTFLKMAAGLANPSLGQVMCSAGKKIGVLIEEPGLFSHLSAIDNVLYKMKILGIKEPSQAEELLGKVGLQNVGRKKVGSFSLGMKQRLGIAMALVGDPDVLLLDEPINGLDPEGVVLVRNLLLDLKKENKIIIVSSHILEELSKIADRYGILDKGFLTKEFDADQIDKDSSICLISVDNEEKAAVVLSDNHIDFLKTDRYFAVTGEEVANRALNILFNSGITVKEYKKAGTSLESILLSKGDGNNA